MRRWNHRGWAAGWMAVLWALWLPAAVAQEDSDAPDVPEEAEHAAAGDAADEDRDAAYANMELLTQVMLHVHKQYVQEKSYKDITAGALHGLLKSLDEHSDYLEPSAYKEMQDDTAGKFSGIGIHVGLRDGTLAVIAPIEDTPAFRAGMLAGDRIVEIDGQTTVGMDMRDAVKKLRGPKGTKVVLGIRRSDVDSPFKIEIVRDDIEVASVKGARLLEGGIGYVRVTQFSQPTAASLAESLGKLKEQGANALVLDLRSNPGGLLQSAIDVSELFLKKGETIVTTKGRKGAAGTVEYRASRDDCLTVPIAVLVDGGSASASEIVAGALQDHKLAVLVGDTTFGKGSVQTVLRLRPEDAGAIRMTTALYYTPGGRQIHGKGLDPDVPVYVAPKEWRDVQLRRAHIETPQLFSDAEKASQTNVVDRPLQRAVDMLQALKAFKK